VRHFVIAIFALVFFGQFGIATISWVAPVAAMAEKSQTAPTIRKPCSTKLRPLFVKIGFMNVGKRPKSSWIEQRFLKRPDRYIREMSYGTTCLAGTITRKWYVLPKPLKHYWVPWQNLKVDKENLRRLVSDTLKLVERDYKIPDFDFLVFVLGANAKQWGNQGLNTYPGILGWKDESQLFTPGGQKIKGGIAIYALSAPVGKVFHNIAHILGGVRNGRRVLPDLYDQVLASSSNVKVPSAAKYYRESQVYMGSWDPMSCNACSQRPDVPGVSSWTKLRLGWLDETRIRTINIGEDVEVWLEPLADKSASTLALRVLLTPSTYYLLENRQRIGHDRNIPKPGVLIMYGDDEVAEPGFGRAPVRLMNADPTVPFLDGAAFEIGKIASFSDSKNGVDIELVRKKGKSYLIRITRRSHLTSVEGSANTPAGQYPFDGRWEVTINEVSGCKSNMARSFQINVKRGKVDAPNYRFPKKGEILPNGDFTIVSNTAAGVIVHTHTGSITGRAGEGHFQGIRPTCTGNVQIVRVE